ncbi:hypothetical protein ACFQ0B_17275 [Nonomuraea thailandensis]
MVDRVLRFLGGIGHLHGSADALSLTERGLRSVRDDRRYTEKQERLRLYFDGVRGGPLRTAHYAHGVRILDRDAAYAQRAILTRALAYVTATRRTISEVTTFLERVCRQLEPDTDVTVDDLHKHARRVGYGALDLKE